MVILLQEVRFVDLKDEAIAALREEVALQGQPFSLSFVGLPADCAAATQDMKDQIQVSACHSVVNPAHPPPLVSMQPVVQGV